ncbi:MAG TPA: hypothetical protein VGE72_04015 [Azospirillum sp.]
MRTLVFLALAGITLTGCADTERIEVAQRAQGALVGMPKGALLSCAGVPERQASADGTEYYTYVARPNYASVGPTTSIGVAGGSGGGGLGVGLGLGVPLFGGGGSARGCEATFVLRGGVVQQVNYGPGADLAACAPIVNTCLAR